MIEPALDRAVGAAGAAAFSGLIDAAIIGAGVIYFFASLLLFVLGFNMAFLSILVWRRGRSATKEAGIDLRQEPGGELPIVTVQLPIYNELYVAERVIDAACRLDYPADRLEIQVLDDSTDETADLIAHVVDEHRRRGVDIVHLHRTNRTGYKAGALANGLTTARGELVAIFDADFIPPPNFLQETVGEFADPQLAFVQGRWGHVNRNYSLITRLQSLAIDAHFMVEQAARRHLGYWFNFNGTAGIWRVAAIESAGGWTADTLTEDLDLSYRAHLKGWRGQFRSDLNVPGELPAQMSSFRRQQHRWARGSLECAHKLLPSVWRSAVPWPVKFQATAHLIAYSIHLLLATIALVYPVIVFAGIRFEGFATLYGFGYLFALSSLAPGIFFITGQRQLDRSWIRDLPKIAAVTVLGSGLMINTVRAALQIFTRPNPEFERTAKFGMEEQDIASEPAGSNGKAADSWLRKRYQLDLDRIVYAEFAFGFYSLSSVWLALQQGNWGIFLYALIFAVGLIGVATITVVQAVAVRRARAARADHMKLEQGRWARYDDAVKSAGAGIDPTRSRAVLVMAKQPVPGASKTRLQPAIDQEQAAALSECFILDAVELAAGLRTDVPGLDVKIAGTPAAAASYFATIAPETGFVAQRGADLSERLHTVMAETLDDGVDQVVAINSDSPTLPGALLVQAFEALDRPDVDVVLGPAEDGGYYLIGWKRVDDRLINDVTMSTPTVLADTLSVAAEQGLSVDLLPSWYDVDQPDDLIRLREELDAGHLCGAHTRAFFADEDLGRRTTPLR